MVPGKAFSHVYANDVAMVTMYLNRLKIPDIPQVYINLEQILTKEIDNISLNCLIYVIQCFDVQKLHSSTLFSNVLDLI